MQFDFEGLGEFRVEHSYRIIFACKGNVSSGTKNKFMEK
jgi:hypothetical protein